MASSDLAAVAFVSGNVAVSTRPALPRPLAAAAPISKASASVQHGASESSLAGKSSSSAAGAAMIGAAAALATRRRQRRTAAKGLAQAEAKQSAPVPIERGSETVLELAKKANVNLEIPKPWELLTGIAKDAARGWFVKRAEEKGIPWNDSVASMEAIQPKLDELYGAINDPTIEYPEYYTQAFHGYDEGNLNWKAAHELEAATFSMCLGYYDGVHWKEAQEMFRGAARSAIAEQWQLAHGNLENGEPMPVPKTLLDVGCSGGFSTHEMAKAFPGVEATGIDLSPHYLSVASSTYPDIHFMHRMAEDTKFPDNSYDVVTLNFILHELPLATSQAALQEAHRILKPGGILAVLDVDPRRLLELPPLRRWAFQVTEPWCKEGEYYSLNAESELKDIGFKDVSLKANDPVNALWLATK